MDGLPVALQPEPGQQPPIRQRIDPHGHVGFCQMPLFHNVPGSIVLRIIGEKQDDVRLQLGQRVPLQQRGEQQPIELSSPTGSDKERRQHGSYSSFLFVIELNCITGKPVCQPPQTEKSLLRKIL